MQYITPQQQAETRRQVHPSQRQHHVTPVSAPLYVVTAVTNPHRYYRRYQLYQAFEKMCADAGAILYTVELAVRDRHHEVTDSSNPRHVQLRSPDIYWAKENLLNLGISRLPADWEYVAWIDADVHFTRPDWVVETLHQLQIYRVVQMWSHSIDLAPDSEHNDCAFQQPIAQCQSLFHSYMRDRAILKPINRTMAAHGNGDGNKSATGRGPGIFSGTAADAYTAPSRPTGLMHTGYAWAARRAAIADLGGLGEIGILGSGDRHMAYALIGEVARSMHRDLQQSYKDYWLEWQERAEKFVQRKIGVVPGTILHYWHGSKQFRRYQDRWKILLDNKFDWRKDLKKDPQGIWMLTDRNYQLRDDLIGYFLVRNEDDLSMT